MTGERATRGCALQPNIASTKVCENAGLEHASPALPVAIS